MSTVLVTGGAGFVGSHVVDAYLEAGYRVIALDDLSSGKRSNLRDDVPFYEADLNDPSVVEILRSEGVAWINHHAAQIDVRHSVADPGNDARINIHGLLNLLEAAVETGVQGVVFVSSGGVVYGEPDELPVGETYPKGPLSPYGVSKLAAEYYLYCYHRVHGLPYTALRYGNVYGPRQDPHGEAGVVAIFSGLLLEGKPPTIFGDGEQLRDYVYVGDVAQANLQAQRRLEAGPPAPSSLDEPAYNVGTGQGTSVNELFHRLASITGFSGAPDHGAERTGELRRIYL
ncbi:MAG: NAD-dependent epimerase/dehydratase family protein, partial [Candidatus Bipolaricaulia bacterium]